jgi:type I restriction enzyme, S subunit
LMALCDQLEAARNEREIRQDRLAAASHHHLNNGSDPESLRRYASFYFTHFQCVTARPAYIRQLRATILNLAIRGRLVAQGPNDEPVGAMLAQNDQARQAIGDEDRRADADSQTLLAADDRWKIPRGWNWRALADLVLFIDYRGKTPTKTERGVRLITAKNVKKGFINISPEEFLCERDYHRWMTRGFPKVGDILFTTEAPMGNAAVVRLEERFALAQRVICFRPYGAMNSDFLTLQLLSDPFQSILNKTATGLTAKGIKAAKLKRLPVAIPPLAEQIRIVAKVNELMALCDRLEAQLTIAQDESDHLLEAVLHHALIDDSLCKELVKQAALK